MTHFDPEFDNISDRPPTAPEVPHADLIADLRGLADLLTGFGNRATLRRAADALAALGDTVPREEHEAVSRDLVWNLRWKEQAQAETLGAERERDEARAEGDALAYVIEQLQEYRLIDESPVDALERIGNLLDTAPAVSLALHDAEVKAQAVLDFAASYDDEWIGGGAVSDYAAGRAAAIRATAK